MAGRETARTWVPGAEGSGFGIEHLPFGVVRVRGGSPGPAIRIGDHSLVLAPLAAAGLLDDIPGSDAEALRWALEAPTLNGVLALGRPAWSGLRARLMEVLGAGNLEIADAGLTDALVPLSEAEELMPVEVGDYVDFYSSIEHASNVGRLMRPDQEPLYPNWRHLPVGYHGRAANLVVSDTPVKRPVGQIGPETPDGQPGLGPEPRLDFELELGFVCGPGPKNAGPIPTDAAAEHIFGFLLVNDWSARSIQAWEYRPLGPFLGKAFATSIAAWITPLEALEPFRVRNRARDPEPLPYLRSDRDWALDLDLEVELVPGETGDGKVISRTNARDLYWTPAQQLAHVTQAGARVRAGDLFASGTISGADPATQGCLLELTRDGREPLRLGGAERAFLEDGDEVVLHGTGASTGDRPAITLAEVSGRVLPAA
ncbi:MAG TPA: fumarylacetoacetase [Solirubrobacterales bacterium]